MRFLYDDLDEFDIDFDDNATARQLLRERIHEQRRLASHRAQGPGRKRGYMDDDYDEDGYEEYEDYDDDEFDSFSGSRFN